MTRITKITLALLLAAGPMLAGCPASRHLAYVLFGGSEQDVEAEFAGLPDHSVAVVIFCDRRVQYDYPNAKLSLSLAIANELQRNVKDVRVIDPRRVVKYQDENIYWDEMDKTALGRVFGADFVLFVPIEEFTTREPGSVNLYRGRILASPVLYQTGLDESDARVWEGGLMRAIYPEKNPTGLLRQSDRDVRWAAERIFADKLARKFYKHKVEIE